MPHDAAYPAPSTFLTALMARCPRCGRGRLFNGYLTLVKRCDVCGLDMAFADSGDGPAVFLILIVGFVVVAAALVTEVTYQPPYWVHAMLWGPLAVGLPLILLRPAKALMIALQFKHDARETHLMD